MNLEEIKVAIGQLAPKEVYALSDWLADYTYQLWDDQIEEDAAAGRLNKFIDEALNESKQGLAKPL